MRGVRVSVPVPRRPASASPSGHGRGAERGARKRRAPRTPRRLLGRRPRGRASGGRTRRDDGSTVCPAGWAAVPRPRRPGGGSGPPPPPPAVAAAVNLPSRGDVHRAAWAQMGFSAGIGSMDAALLAALLLKAPPPPPPQRPAAAPRPYPGGAGRRASPQLAEGPPSSGGGGPSAPAPAGAPADDPSRGAGHAAALPASIFIIQLW